MPYSNNLEAYFKKQELEQIEALRAKARIEKLTKERQTQKDLHYMHCPKCGDTMQIENFENIEVEKCPSCLGIFFDNSELERLLETKVNQQKSIVKKIFGLK